MSYWSDGDYAQADDYLSQAIQAYMEAGEWGQAASAYIWRISANYRLSRFDSLQQLLFRAQSLHNDKQWDNETGTQERVHYYWAMYYEATGQYRSAFAALRKASDLLQQIEEPSAGDSSYLASHLVMSGSIHYDRRDFDQAIQDYQASLAFFPASRPNPPKRLNIVNNMGLAFIEKGEPALGVSYLQENLSLLSELDEDIYAEDYLQTYLNLAKGHLDLGHLQEAEQTLEKVLPYVRKYPTDEHHWYGLRARLLELLGQDRWEEALNAYRKALHLRKQALGEHHPSVAKYQLSIGQLLRRMQRPQAAIQQLQQGLFVLDSELEADNIFANPDLDRAFISYELIVLLQEKGELLYGRYPEAAEDILPTYRLAIQAVDSLRLLYESDASKLLLSRNVKDLFTVAVALIEQAYRQSRDPDLMAEAFLYMEKSKSLVLLENLRKWRDIRLLRQRQQGAASSFTTLLEEEKQIKRDMVLLRRAIFDLRYNSAEGTSATRLPELEQALQQASARYAEIRQEMARESPDYYRASYEQQLVSLHQMQQYLQDRPRSALITYCLTDSLGFSMLVSTDTAILFALAPPAQWRPAFATYNRTLEDRQAGPLQPQYFQDYTAAAAALYQYLLAPQVQKLAGDIGRLYIVPDNVLGFLAFEALLTSYPRLASPTYHPDSLAYLIEEYAIAYGYSATLLLESLIPRPRMQSRSELKNYGGFAPVFSDQREARAISSDCSTDYLPMLPYSRECVEANQALLGGQIYLGDKATVDNFRADALKYRILQLSTHACVDEEDALFNVLYFYDTTLATYEIFDISLAADLIILSACETGRGDLLQGEGIMSLSRAFYYAGCPNVVTSLWPADDHTTKELTVSFSNYLYNGLEKDEALRRAKLDFLTSDNRLGSDRAPVFWATFVLVGNQEALSLSGENTVWLWVVLGVLLLFGLWVISKKNMYKGEKRR